VAAWKQHLLLLSLVACMAARSQLEVGRQGCGRSVGAEDVSGTSGLPIGPACMGNLPYRVCASDEPQHPMNHPTNFTRSTNMRL
jgi:hypothetical protein